MFHDRNGLLSLRVAVPEYQRPLDFPKFPGARLVQLKLVVSAMEGK